MNKSLKFILSILFFIAVYLSLVGFRTHTNFIGKFDLNFLLQIFTIIFVLLGIFMFKVSLRDNNPKLRTTLWFAIWVGVLFFIFIGITYFLHYHIGPFPLYFYWSKIYQTFEILISVIFGALLYYLL